MKKILILLLLMFMLTGCIPSQEKVYAQISTDYKDISLVKALKDNSEYNIDGIDWIKLPYGDYVGRIYYYDKHLLLDLESEVTYIYNLESKNITRFTMYFDTNFNGSSKTWIQFINIVENTENIKFMKFNYLIFEVIQSALKEENQSYVSFNTLSPTQAFHPAIKFKSQDFDKIDYLLDIITDLGWSDQLSSTLYIGVSKLNKTSIEMISEDLIINIEGETTDEVYIRDIACYTRILDIIELI